MIYRYLITYDTPSDKRRHLIDKSLRAYGIRVNYSVFEVSINKALKNQLFSELANSIDPKEDNVRIYRLTKKSLVDSFVLHSKQKVFDEQVIYI